MANKSDTPLKYQVKTNGSINIYVNGSIKTIGKDDLNYDAVLKALKSGDHKTVKTRLSVSDAVSAETNGRCKITNNDVLVDGKALPPAVSARILTMLRENKLNLAPLFRLLENIAANPNEYSRNEFFLFFERNQLPFTDDGHILAYKLVRADFKDIHTGTIDNSIGRVVEMARENVDPDRNNVCSRGLHFCSYDYLPQAYTMGNDHRLLVLKINPADVVSIPKDYNNAKGRTWRYEVVDEIVNRSDSIPKNYTNKYADKDSPYVGNRAEANLPKGPVDTSSVTSKPKADVKDVRQSPAKAAVAPVPAQSFDYSTKLDAKKVKEIRKLIDKGNDTLRSIGEKYGISARQVARIRDGESWGDV